MTYDADSLDEALDAYREFHGCDPTEALVIGNGRRVAVMLGDAIEIVYKPNRGERRGPAFVHKITSRVAVAAVPGGVPRLIPFRGSTFRFDPRYGLMD